MPLSPINIYKDILPKTNCRDCGHPTCFAFATLAVVEKLPLENCPHITPDNLKKYGEELDSQHGDGKWVKKDQAQDALEWARERAASMKIPDLPERIGGDLKNNGTGQYLELPYFLDNLIIKEDDMHLKSGNELTHWEKVFIYNHMAMGGSSEPTGNWKALEEIPNTVSKIKSMIDHVEKPIIRAYTGKKVELKKAGIELGGKEADQKDFSADVALYFRPLPRIPLMFLFWEEEPDEGFEARVKILFDETITEHLDIESIMFLSERLRQLLCGGDDH